MIFDRLALGTANFGKEYNGAKVSEDDQKRILDYCQCSGIDMIDTATAYGWDWTKVNSYFNIIVKVGIDKIADKKILDKPPYCLMAHDNSVKEYFRKFYIEGPIKIGLSIYEESEIPKSGFFQVVQLPYSIYDRRFERHFRNLKSMLCEIHVRSVFLRGKILKEFSPFECISFCLMNPYVDRVIIGADSYEQFKSNLRPFHNMNVAEKHDINLLDPRKWK